MLLFVAQLVQPGAHLVCETELSEALRRAAAPYTQLDCSTATTVVAPTRRLALATVGHSPQQLASRRSVARSENVIVCVDGLAVEPRGRFAAGDAATLLERWHDTDVLEGQFAAIRVDFEGEEIECRTDALGLGPLYSQRLPDGWVVANSVAAIRNLTGANGPDPLGIASFLTLGWAVGGRTLVEPVRALRGGCRTTLSAGGSSEIEDFAPVNVIGRARATPNNAATTRAFVDDMVAMTRAALVDSGLPVKCAVTAGRDSRVALALALAAGARPLTTTIGTEGHIDAVIGRKVADMAGLEHERSEPEPPAGLGEEPIASAGRFAALTDGQSSLMQLQDVSGLDMSVDSVGVLVWGVGGEIARSGAGTLTGFASTAPLVTGSTSLQVRLLRAKARNFGELATRAALDEARRYLDGFAHARVAEGWRPGEVGEAFYTFDRVGRWGSSAIRRASPTDELFTPFASRPYVSYAFSLRPEERYAEAVHRRLLEALAPDLLAIEFETPWRLRHARLAGVDATTRMARLLWSRVADRGRRRASGEDAQPEMPWVFSWLARHRSVIRDVVLSTSVSRVWDFADRTAVERAFADDPRTDWEQAEALLRVASVVFALDEDAGAPRDP